MVLVVRRAGGVLAAVFLVVEVLQQLGQVKIH